MQMQNNNQEKSADNADFFQRLNLAWTRSRLKKGELAKQVGVDPTTVSRWFSSNIPSPGHIRHLSKILGVRNEWLARNDGPMLPLSAAETIKQQELEVGGVDPKIAAILAGGAAGACARMDVDELLEHHAEHLQEMAKEPDQLLRVGTASILSTIAQEFHLRLKKVQNNP